MRALLLLGLLSIACGGDEFTTGGGDGGAGAGTSDGGSSGGGGDSGGGGTGSDAGSGGGSQSGGMGGSMDAGAGGSMGVEGGMSDAYVGAGGAEDGPVVIVTDECPPEPPSDMSVLCKEGLVCTYGDDIRVGCRETYSCSGGVWSASAGACPGDVTQCSDFMSVPIFGMVCNDVGAWCMKDNGEICGCVACSVIECGLAGSQWRCQPFAQDGCPDVPPNRGQACQANTNACTYGFCPLEVYSQAQCHDGAWTYADVACSGVSVP